MLPNKENLVADNNIWGNDLGPKGMIGGDQVIKKPLISPVRHAVRDGGDRMYEQPQQPVNYRGNTRPAQQNYN